MTELTKLACLLAKADIPFELYAFPAGDECAIQIASPSKENQLVDAVSHKFCYGGSEGLIEVLGSVNPKLPNHDVVGWLTAEQAFPYFVNEKSKEE